MKAIVEITFILCMKTICNKKDNKKTIVQTHRKKPVQCGRPSVVRSVTEYMMWGISIITLLSEPKPRELEPP